MSMKCVIAVVPSDRLQALERKLATVHAPGLTTTKVKGYGEYKNFFASDVTTEHTKIEIFVEEASVEAITRAIMDVAQSTVPGAGIVAVMPTEAFFHLHTPPSVSDQ